MATSTAPPSGDPSLSQDAAPADLAWQNRPDRVPQFMGLSDADAAAGQLPNSSSTSSSSSSSSGGSSGGMGSTPTPQSSQSQLGSITSGSNPSGLPDDPSNAPAMSYSSPRPAANPTPAPQSGGHVPGVTVYDPGPAPSPTSQPTPPTPAPAPPSFSDLTKQAAGGNIDALYQSVDGRAPDAAGRAFWQGQINNGLTGDKLLSAFTKASQISSNNENVNPQAVASYSVPAYTNFMNPPSGDQAPMAMPAPPTYSPGPSWANPFSATGSTAAAPTSSTAAPAGASSLPPSGIPLAAALGFNPGSSSGSGGTPEDQAALRSAALRGMF